METRGEEVKVPSDYVAIVGMFGDRDAAEAVVDALMAAGYTEEQVSLVARGAETDASGKFIPGGLMVTASAKGREADAERIMREHDAREVTRNQIGAKGEVGAET
jgi:hypothetical protein